MSTAKLSKGGTTLVYQAGTRLSFLVEHVAVGSWRVIDSWSRSEEELTDDQLLDRFRDQPDVLAAIAEFCAGYRVPEVVEFGARVRQAARGDEESIEPKLEPTTAEKLSRAQDLITEASRLISQCYPSEPNEFSCWLMSAGDSLTQAGDDINIYCEIVVTGDASNGTADD